MSIHQNIQRALDRFAFENAWRNIHSGSEEIQKPQIDYLIHLFAPLAQSACPRSGEREVDVLAKSICQNSARYEDGGVSLLASAIECGANPAYSWLQKSKHIDDKVPMPESLLEVAASSSSKHASDLVEILLKSGANPNDQNYNCVISPIHTAVQNKRLDILTLLLQYGADPNMMSAMGTTPLWHAVVEDFMEGVDVLIKYGADIDFGANDGVSPLATAISAQRLHAKGRSELVVKALLERGANPDIGDFPIWTYALTPNCLHMLPMLLEKVPDIRARCFPLHMLVMRIDHGNPWVKSEFNQAVECLLQHGANIDDVDKSGQTALELARSTQVECAVMWLEERVAELNANALNKSTQTVKLPGRGARL